MNAVATLSSWAVLVTGGTGFIGSHLVRRLVKEGARVHVAARAGNDPWRIRDLLPDLTLWPVDVTDAEAIGRCVTTAKPELVFHLAGTTDGRWLDPQWQQLDASATTNWTGTINVLRAAMRTGLRCFVRAGGLEEYGTGPVPSDENQRERPVSAYSASQVAVTHYCQMLHRAAGAPTVSLRLGLTYGPGQSERFFIPSLIRHCLTGQPFHMSAGEQGRDLVYVDDVVDAFVRAARTPAAVGEVINCCSGQEYRIRDVADLVLRLTGATIPLSVGSAPRRAGEVDHQAGCCDRASRLMGWSPRTKLEGGLARTIAGYREQLRTASPAVVD